MENRSFTTLPTASSRRCSSGGMKKLRGASACRASAFSSRQDRRRLLSRTRTWCQSGPPRWSASMRAMELPARGEVHVWSVDLGRPAAHLAVALSEDELLRAADYKV